MLERGGDQAAGLLTWHLQPPARVVAIAASERGESSHELLWRVRTGCQALQMPCAIVDGGLGLSFDVSLPGQVWLWHAPADVLARRWPVEDSPPLVGLLAEPSALVSAYRDLKRLHRVGFNPVVIALPDPTERAADAHPCPDARVPTPLMAALSALQRTCKTHMDWVPTVWTLGYHQGQLDESSEAALLKILDSAWSLDVAALSSGAGRRC
jgi:hypothetical protein